MSDTIWQLAGGALATRVLGLVAELGVADALAGGPRSAREVADEVGADPDVLERFLRALSREGVFAEPTAGVFENTEASEALAGGQPWAAFAQLYGGVWHGAAGRLEASGRPAFDDFWGWLAEHPRERALFDLAMADGKERRAARLAQVAWADVETVVDVGGGNGSLLLELVERHPGLRGIVFDLPETVRDEAALARAGIEFEGGSFFERVPPADVYVLGTVLHNWPDEEAASILRTIRAAAPGSARLLILDVVLDPETAEPGVLWFDVLGLALFGAHERTEPQWRDLLAAGGFEPVAFHEGLIEAVPTAEARADAK